VAPRLRIRRATFADLPHLVLHRRRMWEDMGVTDRKALDAADPVYRRWLKARLEAGEAGAWVAEAEGAGIVGGGVVWLQEVQPRPGFAGRAGASPRQPYLLSMYTDPDHRGRGVGARIVKEAVRWCRAMGFPRFTLHASDMGRPIYERLGFERTWEMKLQLRGEPVARKGKARAAKRGRRVP
jgi:GNAT superfamily N-acetyltransferase